MGSTQDHPAPFNLTEVDRQVLAQTDEEFAYHDWEELKDIVAHNDLGALRRKPSDLRRYISWTNGIKVKYGSITDYICQKRLRWHEPDPWTTVAAKEDGVAFDSNPVIPFKSPIPFTDATDFKILRNDWPYGVTPGIGHLVVWTKTPIPVKPQNGDVTDESRALIEDFVTKIFAQRLERDPRFAGKDARSHLLWFKNWSSLQSVRSLEHFHLMLRDVPDDIITEWTGEERVVQ